MSIETNWKNEEFGKTFCGVCETKFMQIQNQSTMHYLGNVKDKSMLDIACGEGYFCRLAKFNGALKVVGVDISSEMIKSAQKNDIQNLCEYRQEDAFTTGKIDEFDFVTATGLLMYVITIEDLTKLCRTFYENLKPGGRFAGNGLNCLHADLDWSFCFDELGIVSYKKVSRINNLTSYKGVIDSEKNFKVTVHHFEMEDYKRVFCEVGFENFELKPLYISDEIKQQYPKHCDDYPTVSLGYTAVKPK